MSDRVPGPDGATAPSPLLPGPAWPPAVGPQPWRQGLLGVLGGIGAGKSEFCRLLRESAGWPVLDADAFGHEALAAGSPILAPLLRRFGPGILQEGGAIDRGALARIVFADAAALASLNALTHPFILRRIEESAAALRREGGAPIIVLDAALLADWREQLPLALVVLVTSPLWQRLERLRDRGVSRAEALRRMRRQGPEWARRRVAHWIVRNQGTREDLRRAAAELASDVLARASLAPPRERA